MYYYFKITDLIKKDTKYQVLVGLWITGHSYTLLLGMDNGAAFLENSSALVKKLNSYHTTQQFHS